MSIPKMKQFENGEEFVFDGVKKVPVVGACYAVPRSVCYAIAGNKKQAMSSVRGVAENGVATLKTIASPLSFGIKLGGSFLSKVTR